MGRMAHRYLIFETANGFCGIAWNDVGITRFQLPTRTPTRPSEACCAARLAPNPASRRRKSPKRSPR